MSGKPENDAELIFPPCASVVANIISAARLNDGLIKNFKLLYYSAVHNDIWDR